MWCGTVYCATVWCKLIENSLDRVKGLFSCVWCTIFTTEKKKTIISFRIVSDFFFILDASSSGCPFSLNRWLFLHGTRLQQRWNVIFWLPVIRATFHPSFPLWRTIDFWPGDEHRSSIRINVQLNHKLGSSTTNTVAHLSGWRFCLCDA